MNRFLAIAYGIAIAGIILILAREVIEPSAYLYDRHSPNMGALGGVGWTVATLGPLLLSFCFWRFSQRMRLLWLWHLLFIPCALTLYWLGSAVLFFAADVPDGDSIEGYTLLIASALLALTLIVHGIAAIVAVLCRVISVR